MLDYGNILDARTKRRVLMDEYESQKNRIQYYVDEHDAEDGVKLLEGLIELLDNYLNTSIPPETEA